MLTPVLLALAVVTPTVFTANEIVRYRRHRPYSRRDRRAARARIALLTAASLATIFIVVTRYP